MRYKTESMQCRPGCGACCIAPSIPSPIPGMPQGKPAGVRCVQLDAENRCRIFGRPERPAFCGGLQPAREMCGAAKEQAMVWLAALEGAAGALKQDSRLRTLERCRGCGAAAGGARERTPPFERRTVGFVFAHRHPKNPRRSVRAAPGR